MRGRSVRVAGAGPLAEPRLRFAVRAPGLYRLVAVAAELDVGGVFDVEPE
ncbi:MAG: hypothetical protein ACRD1T_23615 [Acidimicrobiia bacterium]